MLVAIFSPYALWALLLLRVAIGLIFVIHGWGKLNSSGKFGSPSGFIGFLGSLHVPLPSLAGWGVTLLETLGGLLLIIGAFPRLISLLLAINMLMAIVLVKLKSGFTNHEGTGWEYEFLLLIGAVVILLAGTGELAFDPFPGW